MSVKRSIVDLLEEVVDGVREDILTTIIANDKAVNKETLIKAINYEYGSLEEIREKLKLKDGDRVEKYKKYPCIFVVLDAASNVGAAGGYDEKYKVTVGIVHHTDNGYQAGERYEKVVNPIIKPIYESFVQNLLLSGLFVAYDMADIPHTKIELVNIGKEGFVQFSGSTFDFVDGIEMNGLQLIPQQTFC